LRTAVLRLLALIVFALFATQSLADIWEVSRLRGQVFQQVDGEWQPLRRGGSVADDRLIQTGANGHVSLVRGKETIELGPNTEIHIFDKAGAKPFTTVQHHFGTVSIEAEVRNVEHFAVRNQHLAAVVKGTKFTVTSGKTGASVTVKRGQVAVEDVVEHSTTLLAAGQEAKVEDGAVMIVAGKGKLPPVLSKSGKPLAAVSARNPQDVDAAVAKLKAAKASGDPKAIKKAEQALAKVADEVKTKTTKSPVKSDDKAAGKAAADAAKEAEKAARAAEKASRDATRSKGDEEADKGASKAAEEAEKAARKAAEEARKAEEDAAKNKATAEAEEDDGKSSDKAADEARSPPRR
jgi:hypothetical protein